MRVRSFDELIGSRGGRRRDWIHEPWLGVQLRLLPLRLVVRYGPRWRSSNREGRDTLRHELELEVRHRLLRGLDVELEPELRAEDRFGRPDRAWTRVRLMAGVRWRFSRPPSLPSSHRP